MAVLEDTQQRVDLFYSFSVRRMDGNVSVDLPGLCSAVHRCFPADCKSVGSKCDFLCSVDRIFSDGDFLFSCRDIPARILCR